MQKVRNDVLSILTSFWHLNYDILRIRSIINGDSSHSYIVIVVRVEVVDADGQVEGALIVIDTSIDFQYIDVILSNDAIMVIAGRLLPGNEESGGIDSRSLHISRRRRWSYNILGIK